ncbi:hypothetical protein [Nocardioides sp. Leaf285]|uniref:hypothetical protein n=1 Tax=Nocardioides sp. Leaf285 TaxID=1736322 RepID=UPI0007024BB5|nr:hypothetical protein [Nocardioides sp. Leaf285]KQP62983.1 hypothetical protein ASF47_18395 [Nocardioides sp. Leaf285]
MSAEHQARINALTAETADLLALVEAEREACPQDVIEAADEAGDVLADRDTNPALSENGLRVGISNLESALRWLLDRITARHETTPESIAEGARETALTMFGEEQE